MDSWPILSASAAALTAGASIVRGVFSPRGQLFGPVVFRGTSEGSPRIALTFDDGPHASATDAILEILARHRVPAAFFVIGANVVRHAGVLRRIDEAGHLIGNHSYDHAYTGAFRRQSYWADQLARTDEAVHQIIGRRPSLFRPPMGFKPRQLCIAVKNQAKTMVTWTRRGFDGIRASSDRIIDRLARHSKAGDILLLHDGIVPGRSRDPTPTIQALDSIIRILVDRGFEFVRLDALTGLCGVERG